jgi:hypothetical protein
MRHFNYYLGLPYTIEIVPDEDFYLVILSKPADSGKKKTWLRNSYPTSCGKR